MNVLNLFFSTGDVSISALQYGQKLVSVGISFPHPGHIVRSHSILLSSSISFSPTTYVHKIYSASDF